MRRRLRAGLLALGLVGGAAMVLDSPVEAAPAVAAPAETPVFRPLPTSVRTSNWWSTTIWLNRAETQRVAQDAGMLAAFTWFVGPVAGAAATWSAIATNAYNRGGCIKVVYIGKAFGVPQNYWGGNCW